MKVTSISRKLLTRVLSFYFALTFIVTCIQIGAEYLNTKSHIKSELLTLEKTFSSSLTRAVWELNTQQAIDIADGLVAIPMIKGIKVSDENNHVITKLGELEQENAYEDIANGQVDNNLYSTHNYFGHTFALVYEFSGHTTQVGTVTLLSSNQVIFDRIEVGIYFLIGNAMLKTAALMLLFSIAFSQLLTTPLHKLTEKMTQFDIDDLDGSKVYQFHDENNELNLLQNVYNNLIEELIQYQDKLSKAQKEIIASNKKLDEHNLSLEQEVARKTSSLSQSMLKMETQQRELIAQQTQLKAENLHRSKTEKTLILTNKDLKHSLLELSKIKEYLLESEKMVMLGKLSVDVTHDINTPIGVCVTSTSYLSDILSKLKNEANNKELSMRSLNTFIENADNSLSIVTSNLDRASELIHSYKQVSIDQINNKVRQIQLYHYLNNVIKSLSPKIKQKNHTIEVNCPKDIEVYCLPGSIAQVFTLLIFNSLTNGLSNVNQGVISITITSEDDWIKIHYYDNGPAMLEDELEQLFQLSYINKSLEKDQGLGAHIIYNLVTDDLNGEIDVSNKEGYGLCYDIKFKNMM